MAKIDKEKDVTVVEVQPVSAEPVVEETLVLQQPVEKQADLHDAQYNPRAVLQPGRSFKASFAGVIGDIENAIHKAEKNGEHAIANDLHGVLVKMGEVRNHISSVEHRASNELKEIYSKILLLFSK